MEIAAEIKRIESVPIQSTCRMCGESATREVTVGREQTYFGDDYSLCDHADCEQDAIEHYIEEKEFEHAHRRELAGQYAYDFRDGK